MTDPAGRSFALSEIATALNARLYGDASLRIRGAAEPAMAGPDQLALAMQPRFAEGLGQGAARAAILWEGADWRALGLQAALFVPRPRYALAGLTAMLDPGPGLDAGIHPSAVIAPDADLGARVSVGPLAVIGAGAQVGDGTRIGPQTTVGPGVRIGRDGLLLSGVRIARNVTVGDRFIAQPGAVIGGDGLSFVTPEKSGVERARETMGDRGDTRGQSWTRIHSLGGVVVGDDVEIGANACVDAGTIRATRIGDGTKIDNLCQVAHNVDIGRDCLLAGQTGIAGSTRIGDRCVFGGQVGIVDNIVVGADVIAAAGTMILSNAPPGRVLMGYPAVRMELHTEIYKALRRLPRMMAQWRAGENPVPKDGRND